LNVATVMLLFSFDIKEASIYSIATIFFSQISKLGTVFLDKLNLSNIKSVLYNKP